MKYTFNTLVKLWKLLVNDQVAILTAHELNVMLFDAYDKGFNSCYQRFIDTGVIDKKKDH